MATLKDIAQQCGTSIATVSYVLSGRGKERRISDAMQTRILQTAEALNYQYFPKPKKSSAPRIAVYWPQKHIDSILPAFVSGMNSALFLSTTPAEVSIHPFERSSLSSQPYLWRAGSHDAAVIVSASATDLQYLSQRQAQVPTVLVNRSLSGYSSVSFDAVQAGVMAANLAFQRAGNDIAFVMPSMNLYGANIRCKAIFETCEKNGVDLSKSTISCRNEIDDSYAAGQQLILEHKLRKVIICMYDIVAMGVISALNNAGIKVGTDVEIITMDTGYGHLLARMYPGMPIIHLRQSEIATLAMNLAIDIATHDNLQQREIVLPPKLFSK